jgi:hypothetical protein
MQSKLNKKTDEAQFKSYLAYVKEHIPEMTMAGITEQ